MVLERMYNLMMKRLSMGSKEENYEHVLMCLICRCLFDDHDHQPKFLPCHHTFCKDCLRAYIRQMGDEIECPSCRKLATVPAAGVTALQTNFYVKYIQSLVHGGPVSDGTCLQCADHPSHKLEYYCRDCASSICKQCCEPTGENPCAGHKKVPLTTITEEYHQKLDTSFSAAHTFIERKKVDLEKLLKALSEEKDLALLNIDSTFEQHIHTVTRRATLLKNKVIAIYNEQVEQLEADLEEVSTAMTCIVSLKEYHENDIARGSFIEIERGLAEMGEVHSNVAGKIRPTENHIVFEGKHGCERYQPCVKDLGRVRCSRPTAPRTEPEGNDADSKGAAAAAAGPSSSAGPDTGKLGPEKGKSGEEKQAAVSPAPPVAGAPVPIPDLVPQPHAPANTDHPTCEQGVQKADPGASSVPKPAGEDQSVANGLNNNVLDNCPGPPQDPGNTASNLVERPDTGNTASNLVERPDTGNTASNLVVRPKTLSTSPRKNRLYPNNNILKPVKGRRSLEGEDKKPAPPGEEQGLEQGLEAACRGSAGALAAAPGPEFGSNQTTPTGDTGPTLPPPHASHMFESHFELPDPQIELLKQTDKMYHHLVYTSYDEEELLKELKCGKVQRDGEPPGAARDPRERYIEDSDSWMTVSTSSDGSTISGNSDGEEYRYVHTDIDNQESTL